VWCEISTKVGSRSVLPVFYGFYVVDLEKYSASNKRDEALFMFSHIRFAATY